VTAVNAKPKQNFQRPTLPKKTIPKPNIALPFVPVPVAAFPLYKTISLLPFSKRDCPLPKRKNN
jgi:hypothetical protein